MARIKELCEQKGLIFRIDKHCPNETYMIFTKDGYCILSQELGAAKKVLSFVENYSESCLECKWCRTRPIECSHKEAPITPIYKSKEEAKQGCKHFTKEA